MDKTRVNVKKRFTFEEIKAILTDAKNIGPSDTMKKWDLKKFELLEIAHTHKDLYYDRHKYSKEKTLQDEVFILKKQGYTSIEVAKMLNKPVGAINEVWVFVK